MTITVNNVYSQCMYLNVPINWNKTNLTTCTQTIEIFVKRYFLLGYENDSHHLWRIPGGGGIPISRLELESIGIISALNGSISIYLTDKRGVGKSSLLECPISIIENLSACLSYIKENEYRLKENTFTNTGYDLEYILKVINGDYRQYLKSNKRVILMGSSQGTYLLQRYLHITEDNQQVDRIIFDSVLPTDITRLTHGDKYMNYIFLDLFTRCSQDEQECSIYFQDNYPIRALYTYKMNEDFQTNSSCLYQLNITREDIDKKMSFIFYPNSMELFPALIYRINRCNSDDKNVLKHFINVTQPPAQDRLPGYSILVELNNNLAELWSPLNRNEKNPSCDYLKGLSMNTFVGTHVMPDIYCPIEEKKILGYPTDKFYRKYPKKKSKLPLLLLHGDMDSALPIPIARHFYKQYSLINSNITYIEMARTGHTPTTISYILSPRFQPDRSCLDKISKIDFSGRTTRTKRLAIQYFGSDDIWGIKKENETINNLAHVSLQSCEMLSFDDDKILHSIKSKLNSLNNNGTGTIIDSIQTCGYKWNIIENDDGDYFKDHAQRQRSQAFANPEDVVTSKIKNLVPTTTDPDVERVRRNHLNDIENIIPFLLIGFCYIPCNPDPNIALWHFRLFFLSRVLHTFAYQIPLAQPSRAITFFIGLITTVSMAIQVLIRVY
ncbi:unnamed protein product [Rotaria sordida]|uniref:Microsomal glutathione S-transferase 1 n=1 Tax=Rotaria sordida TaxID=392033 RepID=A0A815ARY0_9BILA|nr:unnamed protein product [Rotaria sordida]